MKHSGCPKILFIDVKCLSVIILLASDTPLSAKKLTLTSLTSGGRSVGIVLSRIKATELVQTLTLYLHQYLFLSAVYY
jgi:hypothetical protein